MNPFLRFLYNLFFPLILLVLLPGFLLRMVRRGNYRRNFGQRFGLYDKTTNETLRQIKGRCIWVHAVSVGEILIALKFLRTLRARHPGLPVVLSTTTSTGHALAKNSDIPDVVVVYHPVDLAPVASGVIKKTLPLALVMVEAEIWPNLTHAAKSIGAKLLLLNARLSPRSERRYLRAGPVVASLFRQLDWIGLQEEEDLPRFQNLGASTAALEVSGSVKFDEEPEAPADSSECQVILEALGAGKKRLLLAASTHAGEEEILARIFQNLREDRPDLFLVVVPRHAERRNEVAGALSSAGLRFALRTRSSTAPVDALIVDTTGELRHWYQLQPVVFIGKSLTARGGQNPAEAITAGCPVVTGPHMENFATLTAKLKERGGLVQCQSADEVRPALGKLFDDPSAREKMKVRGKEVLATHHGATDRSVRALERLVSTLGT